jgi:hypothetical protein
VFIEDVHVLAVAVAVFFYQFICSPKQLHDLVPVLIGFGVDKGMVDYRPVILIEAA